MKESKGTGKAVDFILKNLKVICCVVMIVSLFVGNLFVSGEKYGKYTDRYGVAGYHLIFNTSTFYAIILLIVPIVLLFGHHFKQIQKKQSLVYFVLPMLSLAVLMVMKFNLRDLSGQGNAAAAAYAVSFSSAFGLSGWLYLLASIVLIVLGAISFFHLNVNEETVKTALQKKTIEPFQTKREDEPKESEKEGE